MKTFCIPARRNTPIGNIWSYFFSGNNSSNLEYFLRKKYRKKYATVVSSGRRGLQLILASCKFPEGSEVIFPTLTFFELPKIVMEMKLKPVFVNCNNDLQINIDELKGKITNKTKAIIATHLFGSGCRIDIIKKIASLKKIILIEDCAHVHGISYKDKLLGSYGDAAFFSFQNRKMINGLCGGVVITNANKIASYIDEHNSYSSKRVPIIGIFMNMIFYIFTNKYVYKWINLVFFNDFLKNFVLSSYQKIHHENVKKRKNMTYLQKEIVLKQFENIDQTIKQRKKMISIYNKQLKNICSFSGRRNNYYYTYTIPYSNSERLCKRMLQKGIEIKTREDVIKNCGKLYDKKGDYAATEKVLANLVELPFYMQLTKSDILYITNCLRNVICEIDKNF